MKQINWQQSPEEEPPVFNKRVSVKKEGGSNRYSDAFVGRLTETGVKKGKYPRGEAMDTSLNYSQRFIQQSQKNAHAQNPGQKRNSQHHTESISPIRENNYRKDKMDGSQYAYQELLREREHVQVPPTGYTNNGAVPKRSRRPSSRWNMLDLKNKKQTGDLYKKILYLNKKNDAKAFCFTSSRGKEGVSTVLANLVDYIRNQASDKRILVLDANTQSPRLDKTFNMRGLQYGLIDVLNNQIGLRDAIAAITANIFLLNCSSKSHASGNLEPEKLMTLLKESRELFDYILIDCPPVLSSADSLAVAPAVDITFLVIQSIKVQRPVAQKAIALLQDNECEIGGVVLNGVQQVIPKWVYKFI